MNDILFGNNNKKAIIKLAKRSFRTNRMRNIAAILAIAMTAFLFTSVTALAFGLQSSILVTQQIQKGSRADGDIRFMSEAQFNELIKSDFVKRAGHRQFVGFATNVTGHVIEIDYADSVQQELTFCAPTHGAAPKAANEIATSDLALKALGADVRVGASVPIEFELRGQTYRYDMVVSGWWEATNSSVSLMTVSQSFMQENQELFPNTYGMDKEVAGTYFSDVVLKDKSNAKEQLKEFALSVGGDPGDMNAENYILCAENKIATEMVRPEMVFAAACFLFLFAACGYLLIYNIFDISVMRDVRQYGLLRTIGASTRQIKILVHRQAAILTLIALPIGLLLGVFVSWILLPVVMRFFSYDGGTVTQASVSPLIFVIAALFTVATVYISIRKPVKKASKISPLEATRYTGGENFTKKETKGQKGAKLSHMAFSNFGRNKRRSAFIIISLLLCVVLFNSVIIVAQSIDKEKWISRITKTDFTVYNSICLNRSTPFRHHADGLKESAIEAINRQGGIAEARRLYRNTLDDKNVTIDYGIGGLNPIETREANNRMFCSYDNGARVAVSPEESDRFYGNIFGASNSFFDSLTIYEGEENADILKQKLSTGDYVLLGISADKRTGQPNKKLPFASQLKVGDSLSFYKNGELYKTCTILAIAALVPMETETIAGDIGATMIGGDAPYLYLPEDEFKQLYDQPTLLSYGFNAENEKTEMSAFLDEFIDNNPDVSYTSTALLEQQLQSMGNMVMLVGGMIGIVFALAGLINFTNMMITNIVTRKREFATMQSVGMTHCQLGRLMIWEGAYYAIGAGTLGCFIAALLGLTVLRGALSSPSLWYFTLNFTMIPALIVFVVYLMMAILVPIMALRFFNKGTIVERLRISE